MSQLPGRLRAEHARERWDSDWYVETAQSIHSLFDNVEFEGPIHDPCCGGGRIPKIAKHYGYGATGSDLKDRGFGSIGIDYFKDNKVYDNIVSNPPYKLAEEFISHALNHTRHKIAVIVRIPFLAGQKRFKTLYSLRPPAEVLILSRRPSMPPGGTDIPAKGGTSDYVWLIYSQHHTGPTALKWTL